jgi:hypothetical protein
VLGHDDRMDVTTPQRWTDSEWRADVLEWAMRALDRHGLALRAWTQPHVRPWSTVLRLETDDGAFWVKANADGTRHEAALLALLAELDLPATPRPLEVDVQRGYALLPDGGPTLREASGGRATPEQMLPALIEHALLQRATEQHVDALLAVGLDDLRPQRMAAAFAALTDHSEQVGIGDHRLGAYDAQRLRAVLPAYTDACTELAESGIVPALQHDDLHDANVFARGPIVFDWGDAIVGHPFGTLLTTLNSLAYHHKLATDDPALLRLADAATEPWADVATTEERRRILRLAIRTGPITRAAAWRRALEGCDDASCRQWGDGEDGWLLAVLDDDLPTRPRLL